MDTTMAKPKEVAYNALREMYSEAEPSLEFDEVLENPKDFEDGWYDEHYLDSERQEEIVDKHCNKNNLSQSERTAVTMTAILNYGPRGTKYE